MRCLRKQANGLFFRPYFSFRYLILNSYNILLDVTAGSKWIGSIVVIKVRHRQNLSSLDLKHYILHYQADYFIEVQFYEKKISLFLHNSYLHLHLHASGTNLCIWAVGASPQTPLGSLQHSTRAPGP